MHLSKIPALQEEARWRLRGLTRPKVWPGAPGYIILSSPCPPPFRSFSFLILSPSPINRRLPRLQTPESYLALLTEPLSLTISYRLPPSQCKMTITHVRPNDHHHLQEISDVLGAKSKIVTVTGAGISTNAGIPVSIATSSHACL